MHRNQNRMGFDRDAEERDEELLNEYKWTVIQGV